MLARYISANFYTMLNDQWTAEIWHNPLFYQSMDGVGYSRSLLNSASIVGYYFSPHAIFDVWIRGLPESPNLFDWISEYRHFCVPSEYESLIEILNLPGDGAVIGGIGPKLKDGCTAMCRSCQG